MYKLMGHPKDTFCVFWYVALCSPPIKKSPGSSAASNTSLELSPCTLTCIVRSMFPSNAPVHLLSNPVLYAYKMWIRSV